MLQPKGLIRVEKKNAQRKRTTNSVEWIMLRHRTARALPSATKRECVSSPIYTFTKWLTNLMRFFFALTLSSLHFFFLYNKNIFFGFVLL